MEIRHFTFFSKTKTINSETIMKQGHNDQNTHMSGCVRCIQRTLNIVVLKRLMNVHTVQLLLALISSDAGSQ